jgi:hypothetical protein
MPCGNQKDFAGHFYADCPLPKAKVFRVFCHSKVDRFAVQGKISTLRVVFSPETLPLGRTRTFSAFGNGQSVAFKIIKQKSIMTKNEQLTIQKK